jgi:hypothetical protein
MIVLFCQVFQLLKEEIRKKKRKVKAAGSRDYLGKSLYRRQPSIEIKEKGNCVREMPSGDA